MVIDYIFLVTAFIATQDKVEDNLTGKKDQVAERFSKAVDSFFSSHILFPGMFCSPSGRCTVFQQNT